MSRMTTEQLANQEIDGSYERQNAIRAARRRMARGPSQPVDYTKVDALADKMVADKKADFHKVVAAIRGCEVSVVGEMMPRIAIAALKKQYPECVEDVPHAIAAE